MLFNSLSFIGFFSIVLLCYRLMPPVGRRGLLLVASYVFYGSWDWRFLLLILTSTVVDFYCGKAIAKSENLSARRSLLTVSIIVNLGLLGFFKYFNFFADSFVQLFSRFGFEADPITLKIILPVGISFYTFQTLSYTIDVYRERAKPETSPITFALYVAFFPQLVAGPIERAKSLLPQLLSLNTPSWDDVRHGTWLVFWGFFLKLFVADNLAPLADAAFDPSADPDGTAVLLGVYAFAFQIFGDFAGYSSIAIGISRFFGVKLSTNFLFPYFATNPQEFWRNWHISLSRWLRDYLYIPLGGSHGRHVMIYRNLLITMLLGGLWHGAAWTFVVWGLFHGLLLISHRIVRQAFSPGPQANSKGSSILWFGKAFVMFQITCIGWLIFRAPTVEQAGSMLFSIFVDLQMPTQAHIMTALTLVFHTWLLLVVQATQFISGLGWRINHLPSPARVLLFAAMLYSIIIWGEFGGSEFIYFQF